MEEIRQYILEKSPELQEGPIGAAISHVASNAVTKGLIKTAKGRKIAAAIFRKGVKDAAKGRRIIAPVKGASNALMGPELASIYDLGRKSTRVSRLTANLIKKVTGDKTTANQLAKIVTGKSNKKAAKILKKIPTTARPEDKLSKAAEWGTGVATAAATSPTVGGWNLVRTKLSRTNVGSKILRRAAKRARRQGKTMSGFTRAASDYVGSPSLSVATDLGKEAGKVASKFQGNPQATIKLLKDKGVQKTLRGLVRASADDPKARRMVYRQLRQHGVPRQDIRAGIAFIKKDIGGKKKLAGKEVIKRYKSSKAVRQLYTPQPNLAAA